MYDAEYDLLVLATILCRALAKNDGSVDGNRRTAAAATVLFLEPNGYELVVPDNDPEAPWLGGDRGDASRALSPERACTMLLPFLRPLP